MFSGKSTELQRQGKRHAIAGRKVEYFKPSKDSRYSMESIETHDGNKVTAHRIEEAIQLVSLVGFRTNVVCIDEIQFFGKEIVPTIECFLESGIDVIVSGLDLDRFGEPFGNVPELMCKAETVVKLKAVCSECGEDAWVSVGKFKSEEQTVIGEKTLYTPMCRDCYYKEEGICND
jgi:thymidine kinase